MRNGFIILPAAVDPCTIDRLVDLFDKGISEGDPRLRYGAPLVDPALTRKSLVGHFCPEDVYPLAIPYRHRRARRRDGALLYSSYLVNLKNGRFYGGERFDRLRGISNVKNIAKSVTPPVLWNGMRHLWNGMRHLR